MEANSPERGSGERKAGDSGFRRVKSLEGAAEAREGDGLDPKYEARKKDRGGDQERRDHAAERLARRLEDTMGLAISLPAIEGLEDFAIAEVRHGGRGNCFAVRVYCLDPTLRYDPAEIRERLKLARGRLRADIAGSITRKRVPDLVFEVLPPGILP